MKKYIALGGSQGCGKTTFVLGLTHELKKDGHSANCWTDIPRESPLPINENGSEMKAYWITGKMVSRTMELMNIYDYVVSDRTPIDCCIYELIRERRWSNSCKHIMDFTGNFLTSINAQILWVRSGYEPKKLEKGRTADVDFNKRAIDAALEVRSRLKLWEMNGLSVIDVDLKNPPDYNSLINKNC